MQIEVLADADAVARQAAAMIAADCREDVAARGRFVLAVSGGRTPWQMLRALANEDVPWNAVQIVQVDERVAPAGDPDRNLTHLHASLLEHAPLRVDQIHAMPVEATNLEAAAATYANTLRDLCGTPPVIDLVHLGLGPDGHTASLVPGDPVLDVTDRDVATHRQPLSRTAADDAHVSDSQSCATNPVACDGRRQSWPARATCATVIRRFPPAA